MTFDLGALAVRMTVEGRGNVEREIDSVGAAMLRTQGRGDALGLTLGTMGTRTERFGSTLGIVGTEFSNLGDRGRIAFQQIGTGLALAGLAVGALVGLAVVRYSEWDAAVSKSIAVTGAYGEELEKVRDLTIKLGSSTVFTAKEAAEGVTELGKAGVKTADIIGGGLTGALSLAAAGELAVSEAAAVTASTLNQFQLEGRDATHVSDLLAAGANKAQGSVHDMALALKQAGLVANQAGLSVEETTGTLAAFASAGLIGSDAGTSFRQMLLNLMTPTAQQRELLKQYNIEAYDAQGNFVSMTSLAGQLAEGFKGATAEERDFALGIIFGSDAIRAANVLYNQGSAGIRDWTDAVDQSGYAAQIASTMQNNLRGDVEKLGGAFDAALIKTGAGANGVLRELVQHVTELIDGFTELPDWMQQVILVGAALSAGLLLIAGAGSIMISRMLEARLALAALAQSMPLTTAAMGRLATFMTGPWGIAIAVAVVGVQLLTQWIDDAKATSDELQGSIESSGDSIEKLWATASKGQGIIDLGNNLENIAVISERLANGAAPWSFFLDNSGIHQTISTLQNLGTEMADLSKTNLPAAQQAFRTLAGETDGSASSLMGLLNAMPDYKQALIEQLTATGKYAENMTDAAKAEALLEAAQGSAEAQTIANTDAYIAQEDAVNGLYDQLKELIDLVNEANGINQDAVSQNAAYQESLAGITEEVNNQRDAFVAATGSSDGFSLSLDENTVSGSANAAMLAGVARDAQDAAAAQYEVDLKTMGAKDATDKYLGTLAASRDSLIAQAIANGFTAEEVQKLIDKVYAVPTQTQTQALVNTAQAHGALNDLIWSLQNFQNSSYGVNISGYINYLDRADGGMSHPGISYAANGRMPRMSQQDAQMRRAGSWVVWAEDETMGETFIPHAPSKRQRAEMYLAATAALFGGMYLPGGQGRSAADGDMRGSVPATGKHVTLNQTIINPTVHDLVDDARSGAQQAVGALDV